jgi:tetratricopeptide (TPR) repeat protein
VISRREIEQDISDAESSLNANQIGRAKDEFSLAIKRLEDFELGVKRAGSIGGPVAGTLVMNWIDHLQQHGHHHPVLAIAFGILGGRFIGNHVAAIINSENKDLFARAYRGLGRAFFLLGDSKEARSCYAKALIADPENRQTIQEFGGVI